MLEFQQPWWLLLLVAVPAIYFWFLRRGYRLEGVVRFSSLALFQSEALHSSRLKAGILQGLKLLLLTLVSIALARPQLSDVVRETKVEVIDIILVLDISSSMRAADLKPNRLEAAKREARKFIMGRPEDRIGIVVFAAESFIQCPLTHDTHVLLNLMDQVTIVDKQHDGTAIGMAIANSINRLRDTPSASKVMILLSDGSNNAGELDPTTAAQLAQEFGIKIYTIGAGSHGRAPYPVSDPVWGQRMVNVEVELDEETLRQVAEITGGHYFRATDQESLAEIYRQINNLERTEIEIEEYLNIKELYGWFLIPAGILGLLLPVLGIGIFKRFVA
ncbi:MAG: VWA domain-containing protein [Fidelibacterota bacterium]|nr:MAG: VWA domain-containing protein [Candidatus Neomarinimicrobiota bacterium]